MVSIHLLRLKLLDGQELSTDEITRIQAEMEAHNQRMKEARERAVSSASSDFADVHSQSLPASVPVHSMASDVASDTMPDLEPIDGADEESQEEDGGNLMNKVGLVGDFNPDNLLDNQNIKSTGLMFQLFVRDLLSDEMIDLVDRLPTEQKKKQYLVSIIEGLKETAEWQQSGFAGKTVKTEAKKFREMRTYEQMLKEARTRRLKILPERQTRTQQGILLDDVDFDEFDLSKYDRKVNLMIDDNPDKATQTEFNLVSSSQSSVGESMRTSEEVVKEQQEEVSEASSVRSSEKSVDRKEEKQKERSLMRRMFDSMFEEVEVDIEPSQEESVATEESQASSSSLPMNVKKSYEPSSSSSSSRRSSGRSALLPVEEGALSEYVQSSRDSSRGSDERPPETVHSLVPSSAIVEYLQSSPPVSVASSERTIEYIRSRSSSGRSR